jgi:hypothetical protein
MPKGPFLTSEFTPTKFSTDAYKAEFGNHFLLFIESEWAQALFTKDFYHRLSCCFGHIAHYVEREIMQSWRRNTAWTSCFDGESLRIISCCGR